MSAKNGAVLSLLALLCACGSPNTPTIVETGSIPAEPTIDICETDPPTDDIGIFQCSWEHRALTLQRQLGLTLPLREAQIFSSHNSYNSSAYPGVSSSDLNQTRTLPEQFQLGARSFELDVHWIPHAASGGHAPVTCHGLGAGQDHFGCTANDRHLNESLDEIVAFLESPQGQGQVLLFDLEDSLSPGPLNGGGTTAEQAHAAALEAITAKLGNYIYQPQQDAGCQTTPMDLTQQAILDAGKNVILNAPCTHDGWGNWAFEVNSARPNQKAHTGFSGYPDCDSADFTFSQYRERWVRIWEDTTQLGASTNPSLQRMSDQNLEDMAHCGVNFASLDRIDPNPPATGPGNPTYVGQGVNFAALVWSWAEDKPALNETLECAYLDASDGRFHDANCNEVRSYACLQDNALDSPITDASALWQVNGSGNGLTAICPSGYSYGRPENGWLKQQLVEAATNAGAAEVWIQYREISTNTWR